MRSAWRAREGGGAAVRHEHADDRHDEHAERFTLLRPLLFTIAYEILGSATESDDVLQESYLRWAEVDLATVRDTKAYLAQLVTRQALNALRAQAPAGARTTSARGCPSRCCSTTGDASTDVVLAESVSMAMLVVLETLTPDERAVFVLREVFGFDYDEIAAAVGKSAATVRQVAHRAREHVQARRKRFEPVDSASDRRRLTEQFLSAAATGDVDGLMAMLAPDVVWTADSDGKASAARRPVVGAAKVAAALARAVPARQQLPDVRDRAGAFYNSAPAISCLPRRQPGGRLHRRDHRRQDHALLRDAQPREAGGDSGPADPSVGRFCHARSVRIDRLGELGSATGGAARPGVGDVAAAALPPPAALTGDWFGSRAVIVPSVAIEPVGVGDVFDTAPGSPGDEVGGGWIGYLSYPDAGIDGTGPRIPEAAGGWTDDVLRQDRDGTWWYESLSGDSAPPWLVDALTADVPETSCHVDWGHADRDAHQAGVLACLEAIAAGEVYQACVCTQFVGAVSGAPVDFFADAVARTATRPCGVRRGRLGRGGVAVARTVPAPRRGRRRLESHQGHAADRRAAVGAARVGQGRRREHHDRRPGPQRPEPRRGDRQRHRAGAADRAPRARGVASGVDGLRARRRRPCRWPRCSTRRFRPPR